MLTYYTVLLITCILKNSFSSFYTFYIGKETKKSHHDRKCHNQRSQPFSNIKRKRRNKPPHDKTNKMARAPNEDSDQPGHPPVWSVWSVFAVLSYPLSASKDSDQPGRIPRLICLRWAHSHFVGFVMRLLKYVQTQNQIKTWTYKQMDGKAFIAR